MKITLLSICLALSCLQSFSQKWSSGKVSMGQGFEDNVYFDLQTGTIVATSNNSDWDLGFFVGASGQNSFSASVRANTAQAIKSTGTARMLVYSTHKSSAQFDSVSYIDTLNLGTPLWNDPSNYDKGAFNQNADTANLFDFGWGKYNASNHNLYGDSVYLIQRGNVYYKLIIDSLNGYNSTWYARYAQLGSSFSNSFVINDAPSFPYSNKNFVYYSIATKTIQDLEPPANTWDLNFTLYSPIISIQGVPTRVSTAGPLLHRGHRAAKLANVYPDTATAMTAALQSYNADIDIMAYDWRYPGTNDTIGNLSYFIQPGDDSTTVYQIVFTEYIPGGGRFYFLYRSFPNITSVASLDSAFSNISLFPNPSNIGEVYISLESDRSLSGAEISVYDMMGRLVSSKYANIRNGNNAFSLSTEGWADGAYVLSISKSGHRIATSTFEVKN